MTDPASSGRGGGTSEDRTRALFRGVEALTFDCYGTIIDWERGILEALAALLGDARAVGRDDERLETFARLEARAESGAFRPYRAVLEDVARGFGSEYGVTVQDDDAGAFADSVGRWPPFDDAREALAILAGRYSLAIVSNVDDDLFAGSAAQLGIAFTEVVTAQQIRSYKPAPTHFREVLRRLDLPRERVIHVAQSLYHDIAPATTLGLRCVWVDRRAGRSGGGATPPASATPDLTVPDLATLATLAV